MYVCAGSLSTCARRSTAPQYEQAAEESGSSYCSATMRQHTNLRSRMCSWRPSCVHVGNGFCSREYKYGCTYRVQCMSEVIKGFQFIIYRLSQQFAHIAVQKYLTDSSYVPTCGGSQLHGPNNTAILNCLSCHAHTHTHTHTHSFRSPFSTLLDDVTLHMFKFSHNS